MTRHRTLIRLSAALAGVALVWACGGDSPTAPPTPEPARPTTVTVEMSPSVETIALGSTLQLTAEGFDENGHAVESVQFSWESSDVTVATVDASGLVTGVTVGTVTITASAGSGQGTAEITVMDLERAALAALYNATDGPNWVDAENWLTDAPLGEWYGVDTDGSGRVVALNLAGKTDPWPDVTPHGLEGPIPPEIGSLASLRRLSLAYNHLTGPIPPEIGSLGHLQWLDLDDNALTGPIPPEIGSLGSLEGLDLDNNALTGPVPPELGNLVSLVDLDLTGNDLTGPIPSELGGLANLEALHLGSNDLTGPIPENFLELDALERFRFERNADLCAPGTTDFVTWLERIETVSGPYCNESDVGVFNLLYQASGGPDWTNSSGWLETPALDDWYGVTADALGRVVTLDLSRNGLAGQLPVNLSELAHMTELRIAHNTELSGRLPLSLADLSLRALHYDGTELCAPVDTSFRDWLSAIPSHEGTGGECGPLSDREVLEALYDATGGPAWIYNENWRTDAPLGEWHGVQVDDQGRVVGLRFVANRLTGRIPRELGGLPNLRTLYIGRNDLTGLIPSELGNLANLRTLSLFANGLTGRIPLELAGLTNLRTLYLGRNDLTGPIPPELGRLANLRTLSLGANRLTGRIPRELGGLPNLRTLYLGPNDLTGPIPSELGNLANLRTLSLFANGLTGRIPLELGGLADLSILYLGENELAGPVPPEFGGLTRLRNLALQANADMSGTLPASLTNLASLETFQTAGTALCPPSDAGFLEWLQGVPNRRVPLCDGEPAVAYLVQAVQSREFPVPLVSGEEALLRVFVTAGRDNDERLPPVRASFHLGGTLVHVADIPGRPGPIPTEVDEGSLATSANAVIPEDVVLPGLEMVVEVDPDGTLDPALGVARRIPATGRAAIEVQALPLFDVTLVPFLWTAEPNSAILESVGGMAADPEGHELLGLTRTLLPVGDLKVEAHEPVLSSSNYAYDLIAQTRAIRVVEGGTGYWMGTMSGSVTGAAGLAGRVASFAVPHADVIAHEFGHNFSLPHAPCGGARGTDPAYPYPDGSIGAWGYDSSGGLLVRPYTPDIMGFCKPPDWISDYFFTKALHFRLFDEQQTLVASLSAQEAESLLLWGGADADGEPYLNPAFVVDAPPVLPDAAGEHRIAGRTADGDELFSLDFTLPETADGDGQGSFVFALPADLAWAGNLASITLSGPGGSATLDGDTDLPMTVLLDPVNGQVRAILRDLPQADAAAALAPQAGPDSLDVLFSRGIPDAAAWSR